MLSRINIDINTLKFISVLNELAEFTTKKILSFSKCTERNKNEYIFYDKRRKNKNGTYKIVDRCVVDKETKKIISYMEFADSIGVMLDKFEEPCIVITIGDEAIFIEDGQWYFA